MFTQEFILREIDSEIADAHKNGPGNVMNKLHLSSDISEAKQALGYLQGFIKGLEALREKALRWEED